MSNEIGSNERTGENDGADTTGLASKIRGSVKDDHGYLMVVGIAAASGAIAGYIAGLFVSRRKREFSVKPGHGGQG